MKTPLMNVFSRIALLLFAGLCVSFLLSWFLSLFPTSLSIWLTRCGLVLQLFGVISFIPQIVGAEKLQSEEKRLRSIRERRNLSSEPVLLVPWPWPFVETLLWLDISAALIVFILNVWKQAPHFSNGSNSSRQTIFFILFLVAMPTFAAFLTDALMVAFITILHFFVKFLEGDRQVGCMATTMIVVGTLLQIIATGFS